MTKALELPRPLTAWELRATPADIVAEVDRLTNDYTDRQIVEIVNFSAGVCPDAANDSTAASLRISAVSTSSNRAMIGYARRAC